eukprot:TRINITY_DN2245_c0_g1_i1.p1 TRINITY_DN2245_c0_g1~~TRINITY_DN2245_c0_g1_i1.p1  ORF type:complete len:1149 (+),score=304.37 TRINITY_DN2245_c0_g1_i1:87-3533(+)
MPRAPQRVVHGWEPRLRAHWVETAGSYWWQESAHGAAPRRVISYLYLSDSDYHQWRDKVHAERLVTAEGEVRWIVRGDGAPPPATSPTASASPLRSTAGSAQPPPELRSARSLFSPASQSGSPGARSPRSPGSPGSPGSPASPGGTKTGGKLQGRARRRPHPLAVKTHSQLLGQRLRFEDATEGQTVRMTPHGCDPTLAAECLYTGTIVKVEKDSITVLWNNPDDHGPPERFGNPPRPDRERQEPRHWWDGAGNPVLGELSVEQKFRQRKMRKEAKEAHATRKALLEPRPEHEKLRERHQFQELKQSRDDFLVIFGGGEDENSAQYFKRRHLAPAYGVQEQKIGFMTPCEAPYRPLGERTRRIQTRVRDLTAGLRFPPQKPKEQRRRQERQQAQGTASITDVAKAAVHHSHERSRKVKLGCRTTGGAPRSRGPAGAHAGAGPEEDDVPMQRMLAELLKKVDRASEKDDKGGWKRPAAQEIIDERGRVSVMNCTPAQAEGVRELMLRRRMRRQRRVDDAQHVDSVFGDGDAAARRRGRAQLCVGDAVQLAAAEGQHAAAADGAPGGAPSGRPAAGCLHPGETGMVLRAADERGCLVRGPRGDTAWYRDGELATRQHGRPLSHQAALSGFHFPRFELEQSRQRIDHARKGESFVRGLEACIPDEELFPAIDSREEGKYLSQRARQEAEQAALRQQRVDASAEGDDGTAEDHGESDGSGSPYDSPSCDGDGPAQPRRRSRPGTAPVAGRPRAGVPKSLGASVFLTEVNQSGDGPQVPNSTLSAATAQPLPTGPVPLSENEAQWLLTTALQSREWQKRWHSGKQRIYYQHRQTGRKVLDLARYLHRHPPGDKSAIGNWRLRCVEKFDPRVQPEPRRHEGVGKDGADVEVDGLDCVYWHTRFQHTQYQLHTRLASQLERRRANRARVYTKVDLLCKMLGDATEQAAAWQLSGQTRRGPRRGATPAPSCSPAASLGGAQSASEPAASLRSGGRSAQPPRPGSAPPTRGVPPAVPGDVWTRSMRGLSKTEDEKAQRLAFYEKMLYYCDLVGGPTTMPCKALVNECRNLLVRRLLPGRELLCRAVAALPTGALCDAETEKVLKFMRSDLGVSIDDIVIWFEQQGLRPPAGVDALRAKERSAGLSATFDYSSGPQQK